MDGNVCLRDDKNAAFVELHHLLPWKVSLANVTMCVRISREPVSDWLNPLSLGTMSAFVYMENSA